MTYITVGEQKFKGFARDGELMKDKIDRICSLWATGVYTPRSIGKKVGLDYRTVEDVLNAQKLI